MDESHGLPTGLPGSSLASSSPSSTQSERRSAPLTKGGKDRAPCEMASQAPHTAPSLPPSPTDCAPSSWPPFCCSDKPAMLPSPGVCSGHSLFLEDSSPRHWHDCYPTFSQITAQTFPLRESPLFLTIRRRVAAPSTTPYHGKLFYFS